ncbi:MAG: ABC transporter ATP-binding protein [bacterium]|nr:ABC transporter ATP-binding protein [bacterium]
MKESCAKAYISYSHVYKAFDAHHVCKDFNLDINKGETLSVIGPSGVGKTVVTKLLIGLLEVDKGEIYFDGINVTDFRKDRQFLPVRKRISMVFQWAALFDSMSVFDNIAYPLRVQFKLSKSELEDRVHEKLEWVGLPDIANKMPSELSGGMKKRVGLARAIATDPEVILYDEPTTGLDPINTVRITDLIMSLQERLKCTSIVVIHDIHAAMRLSDRVAFMYDGKIRALGDMDSLIKGPDSFVRGFILGDPTLADY